MQGLRELQQKQRRSRISHLDSKFCRNPGPHLRCHPLRLSRDQEERRLAVSCTGGVGDCMMCTDTVGSAVPNAGFFIAATWNPTCNTLLSWFDLILANFGILLYRYMYDVRLCTNVFNSSFAFQHLPVLLETSEPFRSGGLQFERLLGIRWMPNRLNPNLRPSGATCFSY